MEQIHCDLDNWVRQAPREQEEFRQAVQVILTAITYDLNLRDTMVMKGGLLMAIRYHSCRFTTDLDFSTTATRKNFDSDLFCANLIRSLAMAVADSQYVIDCRLQRFKFNPSNEDSQFSSIELKIGYAHKGTPKHRRLVSGESPTTVEIDFSLNEPIIDIESLNFGQGQSIQAYAFADLVAEKLRALLQQEKRNRFRRQDVYDLRILLKREVSTEAKIPILSSLMEKSKARGIDPNPDSLSCPEIRRRAKRDYPTLIDEIKDELPDFDESYEMVEAFYRSLPWPPL